MTWNHTAGSTRRSPERHSLTRSRPVPAAGAVCRRAARLVWLLPLLLGMTACRSSSSIIRQQERDLEMAYEENERIQQRLRAAANRAAQLELETERLRRIVDSEGSAAGPSRAGAERKVLHVEVLSVDDYFLPESAQLSPAGVQRLAPIITQLKQDYPTQPIRVEGYTDDSIVSDRLKRAFPSNWELSAARAAMVVRHLQWTHQVDAGRLTVVGHGHYHPLADLSTDEGDRLNRVVRIVVLEQ